MTILEKLPPLSASAFFRFSWECPYLNDSKTIGKKYRLPTISELTGEKELAHLAMGWNEEEIIVHIEIHHPIGDDFIELFFDTRDQKEKGQITKFCHQFMLIPNQMAQEITRFRGEDFHPICDSKDLSVQTQGEKSSYQMQITIPRHCLFGYDPNQLPRIGFAARLKTSAGEQHFAASFHDFSLEKNPSLWPSIILSRR